jgi:hypothetical protein
VAAGGLTDEYLVKLSATDYDTVWKPIVVDPRLPLGFQWYGVGPPTQTDAVSSVVTLITATIPTVAGRKYRITGYGAGEQVTAPGGPGTGQNYRVISPAGASVFAQQISTPVGGRIFGSGSLYYVGVGGMETFTLGSYLINGGALRTAPNACWMLIEDIGG